jgi:hypothetical protein
MVPLSIRRERTQSAGGRRSEHTCLSEPSQFCCRHLTAISASSDGRFAPQAAFTTDKVCLLSLSVIELPPLCRNLISQRIDFIRKTTLAGDHNHRARKVDLHSSNSSRKSFIRSKGFALRLPI